MNAQTILEQLTNTYALRDLLNIEKAQLRDDAIPDEVQAKLADIEAEYAPKIQQCEELIARLEEQAKQTVLDEGATAKGGALQAVFMKGRVSWDSKKLDGMMIILPQLKEARKEGAPTVTIRKIG
jgi:phage host-nuclease inhibitor protein Gam